MRCGRPGRRLLARAAWFALLACAAAVTPGRAQSADDGGLGGRVLSATGSPVAGARVVLRSLETGAEVRTASGTSGDFLIVRLPVGSYRVAIETAGAETALPGNAEIRLGEVTEIEARVGPVAAALSSVATVTASMAAADDTELASLPVPEGDWRSLELTEPGANAAGTSDSAAAEVSFHGLDPTENSNATDGLSAEESFSGERLGGGVSEDGSASETPDDLASGPGSGSRSVGSGGRTAGSAFTFSGSAVREFRVNGGDAAQYGSALSAHGGGGVLTAVTRAGGAQFHGSATFVARATAWAAADPFAIATSYDNGVVSSGLVKPPDVEQRFGGSVGGPVPGTGAVNAMLRGRDPRGAGVSSERAFFYYAFDGLHRNFPAVSSPGYASFYSLTAMQTALLANRGVSVANTEAALTYLDSLTGTVPRRSDEDVNFGRLDWLAPHRQRVSVEYNRARWSNPAGARSSAVLDRAVSSVGSSYGKADTALLRWVAPVAVRLTNELRLQFGHELQYESVQPALAQEPAVGPGGLPPEVSIGPSGFVFGTPASLGRRAWPDERRLEAADVLAWTHGGQLVQLGFDMSALRDFTDSLTNSEGTFSYDSGVTDGKAGGLVDWITDYTFGVNAYPNGACPSITAATHYFCFLSYSQSFGQQSVRFGRQEWAGFVQDDWRVNRSLTVHAGVRYEYEFLPLPQQPDAGLDAVFGARGATSVFPEDRNNFGPRLGLVWRPLRRDSGMVSAGYGIYYGRLTGQTIQAALLDTAMTSSDTRIRILPTTETACPQQPTVGFGYPCSFLAEPGGVAAATTSALVFDRRFRLPAIQQGTLAYEHSIAGGVLGRISYTMNLDRQLPDSIDINIAPSDDVRAFQLQGGTGRPGARDGETFVVPVYTTRVSPSFGPVTDLVSDVNATYHGMTLEARRGYAGSRRAALRGLDFRAAFTWSKAIDFGQNPGAQPRSVGQFDPFNVRYDKGLSTLNFPHRLAGSVVWSPVSSSGGSLFGGTRAGALARGWTLAAIGTESSGRGYSYEVFGGTRLTGGRESINGSGGSMVLPTAGRNTLRLPDRVNLDLRLERGFALPREGMRLLASAEVFNATNHVNVSGVEQRAYLAGTAVNGITPLVFQDAEAVASEGLNVQPFGTYTSSTAGESGQRKIELRVRLQF